MADKRFDEQMNSELKRIVDIVSHNNSSLLKVLAKLFGIEVPEDKGKENAVLDFAGLAGKWLKELIFIEEIVRDNRESIFCILDKIAPKETEVSETACSQS